MKKPSLATKKNIKSVITIIPMSTSPIYSSSSSSQLTALLSLATHTTLCINLRHRSTALLVRIRQQRALVEFLRARRHVDGRVAREEVDGLEADFEDLAGHYGEVFDAWDLVERGSLSVGWGWVGI